MLLVSLGRKSFKFKHEYQYLKLYKRMHCQISFIIFYEFSALLFLNII